MKYTALSLFVIGVVNAGTMHTSTSSSGSSNGAALPLVNNQGAVFAVNPAGSAQAIAAQGGATASGSSVNGWVNHHSNDWAAQCDEDDLEECHHDIHIGNAGPGASGDAVSHQVIVAAGEQVIPAQVI